MPASEISGRSIGAVIAAFVGSACNGMVLASVALSVFLSQIAADYHWTHAQVGGAATALFLGMAIGAPAFGHLIDRVGARAVLLPLTVSSGLILASISWIPGSLILFYAAHLALGISQPGAIAYSKLLSTWFERRRGLALTVSGLGVFVAQAGGPLIAGYIGSAAGWHSAYRTFASFELAIAFPILLLLFQERPVAADIRPSTSAAMSAGDPDRSMTLREAARRREFWLLIGAQAAGLFTFFAVSTHAVGIVAERGAASATAAWGLSAFAAGGLLGQPLTGYVLDRFMTPRAVLPFSTLALGCMVLLLAATDVPLIICLLGALGIGCGGQTSVAAYLTTRFFGVANYSKVYGSSFPILLALSAPAPALTGALYDANGSYAVVTMILAMVLVAPNLCIWLLPPYPRALNS